MVWNHARTKFSVPLNPAYPEYDVDGIAVPIDVN